MFFSVSDAAMKKVKHRLVEKMNESTADSLGLSRAVLVNGRTIAYMCMYTSVSSQCVPFCSDNLFMLHFSDNI